MRTLALGPGQRVGRHGFGPLRNLSGAFLLHTPRYTLLARELCVVADFVTFVRMIKECDKEEEGEIKDHISNLKLALFSENI